MQKHEEGGLQKRGFLGVANAGTARAEYAENTYTWSWMPAYHSPTSKWRIASPVLMSGRSICCYYVAVRLEGNSQPSRSHGFNNLLLIEAFLHAAEARLGELTWQQR